jgi:hypothetical protein
MENAILGKDFNCGATSSFFHVFTPLFFKPKLRLILMIRCIGFCFHFVHYWKILSFELTLHTQLFWIQELKLRYIFILVKGESNILILAFWHCIWFLDFFQISRIWTFSSFLNKWINKNTYPFFYPKRVYNKGISRFYPSTKTSSFFNTWTLTWWKKIEC